jgi:PAS domain S-box-containing protein
VAGESILVVGPDATLLKTLEKQVLAPYGFKLLLARGQEEGMKIALAESPHLLLLHLPSDSSARLLHRLAQAGRAMPAILIVKQESAPVAIELLRLGVRDYVVHPFKTEEVVRTIHRVLGQESRVLDYRPLPDDLDRINRELEQRLKEFDRLLRIGRSVSALLDLDSVLNRVTEAAVYITNAEEGYLLLLDEETAVLRLRAAQNLGDKQAQALNLRVTDSIAGTVIRSGKPILLNGGDEQHIKIKTGYLVKSLLNVPLKANGRIMGVLGVSNRLSNAHFTPAHLYQLSALADMAATALENARQYTAMRTKHIRRVKEFATLQTVAGQLSLVTDFDVGARLALSLVLKATNAEAGVLAWVVDKHERRRRYVSEGTLGELVLNYRNGSTLDCWWDDQKLQEVIESGQSVLEDDFEHRADVHGLSQTHSRLMVPMRRGKRIVGAINLESSLPRAFIQDDLHFVTSIADQVAIALEGAMLQEKVETGQEQLSLLMKAVDDAVWWLDANLHLVEQNEAASELVGWSSDEAIGRSIYDLLPWRNGSSHELGQLLHQAMEKQQPVSFDNGLVLARKNGQQDQPVLVGGRVVPIVRGGQALGAVCAFQEISPSDDEAYLRLEFADMASHLLRTPLSFIQTSIDFLTNCELGIEDQQVTLDKMREQSLRLTEFTNELLKMLRLETEGMCIRAEPIALLPLIEQVLDLIKDEEPRHVFNLVMTGALPMVVADHTKTELIVLNLLLSAVRRCPAGGHITIKLEVRKSEVIVSITDNGNPIPAKLLDKIFWQFYPVDADQDKMPSTYQLGFYTTKRLVELQNGRIWAESWPSEGSQFSFSLPVWEKQQ